MGPGKFRGRGGRRLRGVGVSWGWTLAVGSPKTMPRDVVELAGEAEVVEHAVPLVGLGADVFEEEDGGLGEVEGVGGAEGFGEDGEAAAEESAFGAAGLEGAEAVGGVDGPGCVGVEGGVPGAEVDAVGVGPVGGGHGGVEGGEVAEVPEVDVERGVVAVADEGFGVGADEAASRRGRSSAEPQPPRVQRMASMVGSAKAAWRSATRSAAVPA